MNRAMLFAFMVDTGELRGDSIHAKEFIKAVTESFPGRYFFLTLNAFSHWEGRWITVRRLPGGSRRARFLWAQLFLFVVGTAACLRYRVHSLYLRYCPGMSLAVIWFYLLGRRVIVEMNAVVSDEFEDLCKPRVLRCIAWFEERLIGRLCQHIVCVTPEIGAFYQSLAPTAENKVVTVYNGVDERRFKPMDHFQARTAVRAWLPLGDGEFVVGYVGTFTPWQDLESLVKAARLLKEQGQDNIRFVVVGDGVDSARIHRLVREQELQDWFLFTGFVQHEQVPLLINSFDVCVAPLKGNRRRRTGTAAIKIFEYAACGKPVIVSRVGHLPQYLASEGAGLTFEPENPQALAERILTLYGGTDRRKAMGQKARQIAERRFTWQAVARSVLSLAAEKKI